MNTEMINKRMKIIDDLQGELNKMKEMYDETLENDATFQEVQEEMTKVKEEFKEKQEKILTNTSYKHILEQIKEKRQELKEHKEALSQELVDYYRESGTPEIEDDEGNVKRMKFSVRLVR
jgi:cell shape-determining protein MreC